jgi:hypothetical protein
LRIALMSQLQPEERRMQAKDRKTEQAAKKPSKALTDEERMDDAIEQSFSASDPPPTSPMTTGAPRRDTNKTIHRDGEKNQLQR